MTTHNQTIRGKNNVVYLIDGSAYVYRAFHAIRELTNSKGQPTNAVFGFTRMLIKLIQECNPEYAAMFFDTKGPTFRHELYDDYKANRPPMPNELAAQIPYIKKVTQGFRIPVLEKAGFEADDLIGTFARLLADKEFNVIMVTGDKDYLQLVNERVSLWDPMKEKQTDLDTVWQAYQLKPEQIVDMMGLTGDSADNVPGVPSIGPKTALKLIQAYGSMETLYDQLDAITAKKQRENLVEFKEQAFLSRKLVTIDTHVPVTFNLDELKLEKQDDTVLGELFQELEFRQLQSEFQKAKPQKPVSYKAILDEEELEALIQRMGSADIVSIDTETTSQDPMQAVLVGLSIALEPYEAYYIPCGHHYIGAPKQLPRKKVLDLLKPVLENPDVPKLGQNIKYDWMVLARNGVHIQGVVFDTMLASYLLNPSKRAHNLDQIALDFLNHKNISYSDVAGKGKKALTFDQVTLEQAVPYACEDADITLRAYQLLKKHLEELDLFSLMKNVEMPLVPVLMQMEMSGICLDEEKLYSLSKSFEQQLQQLEKQIYSLAGESFNINSSQQLGRILFEKLALPTVKKTKKKTGYSTDVEVLTKLAQQHELPGLILRRRSLAKLKSTYTDALLEQVNPETGRIHTSFNQTVTATGRLSSSNPNLQNIPIRTPEGRDIRKAFIPQPGWLLLAADYSQIELRLLAHVAKDQILIDAFKRQEDIHTRTASEVFNIPANEATPELRRQAKAINFGIVYGMSSFGLSKELDITPKMAQNYIDQYFDRYQGVKQYMTDTIEQARKTQRTTTLLGRLRLLADINSSNSTIRQFAERTAINTPIQGSAADLIKLAMIHMGGALKKQGMASAMLLSVHDEIVFETPPEELEMLKKLTLNVMENVWKLDVPLKVNVSWGQNWTEAH
ncbi:MAG: DNA polymerase I [Desulfobacteraceae bacterium]|nr:DNA polymerase I [Desulfobacteraceae bacterium]